MALAYIILAHKNPLQLKRLLKSLSYECVDFFIHIDKRVDKKHFLDITTNNDISRFFWVDNVDSPWGSFGLVEAVLNALNDIINSNNYYDNIIVLSGQDYPIQKNKNITEYFKKNSHKSHVSYFECVYDPQQEKWKNDILIERLGKTILSIGKYNIRIKNDTLLLIEKVLSLFYNGNRIVLAKRSQVERFFADSQWFSLSHHAADFIVKYVKNNQTYVNFFKKTYIPDEIFFQTILLNSKDHSIISNLVNSSLHYIDWTRPEIYHPMIFSQTDFANLVSSEKMFARKFDITICIRILDMIDEYRQ